MSASSESADKRARSLPSGTVTFAFTDIEGSSQRWDRDRAAMQLALRRHDAILRECVNEQGGYVFKTIGDAFCSVFWRPEEAVAAIVAVQRALAAEDFSAIDGLRVRAALHTGTADERDADYFGPAVNRVARLLAIGHGGQVLLSAATREIAHSDLPSGTSLADLGLQWLKGLSEPEHVWQLSVAGLQQEFPPLRGLFTCPNNLPLQVTSFVGRERDLVEVKELLARHRLVTLFGSGGVGKTRLALQIGAGLLDQYLDGIWFVDFAAITDPELVSSVVAKVLGMNQQEGRRVDESIPPWLKRKKLLLILDNCEHVLDPIASLVAAILKTAPDVRLLATSRQALGVAGESLHRLPSLAVPIESAGLRVEDALEYSAIALFVDRAQMANTSFALTDGTASIVAEICRRLDGIPLAIELAAARTKVLSISNIAQHLNERFKLLTGGTRDVLPRQRTLSALIDWSFDLLTPQEQLLFTRLGVFASGFGLEAATAVCSGDGLEDTEILDLLASLTDKSLVVADTSRERERYRLLDSTSAFALEKLSTSGDRERLPRRHAEYFRSEAEAADERAGTGSSLVWLGAVELEFDNYRAALEWSLTQQNDSVLGGAIAGALGNMWSRAGLVVEGRYWSALALERLSEEEHPRIVARLLYAVSLMSAGKRRYELAEQALRLFEALSDVRWSGRAQYGLSDGLYHMGRFDEASAANAKALMTARACADASSIANCLNQEALIEIARGDLDAARKFFAQAIAALKGLGDEARASVPLSNLAELEFNEGHPEEALRLASEALEIRARGRNKQHLAASHANLAAYRIALGDLRSGRASAAEALHWARQGRVELLVAVALQHLALLSALGGNARRAATLLGYADAQYKAMGIERASTEQWGYDKVTRALREALSEAEIAQLTAEGAAWSEDQAAAEALQV